MKILLVNKYYYFQGGSEKYLYELEDLLKSHGHEVRVFSTLDSRNKPTIDSMFFITNKNFSQMSFGQKVKELKNLFWRQESVNKLKELLAEFRPDVVHLNNINFQISTSIIDFFHQQNIPMVMTLHDYQLVCPNHLLYHDGHYCPRCLKSHFWHCLFHRCYNKSFIYSLLVSLESLYNHWRKVYRKINLFIAPTQFMKDRLVEFGFPAEKIKVLYNFLELEKYQNQEPIVKENFYFYLGRLFEEKGVVELVNFFNNRQEILKLAGTGDLENKLKESNKGRIEFLGQLPNEQAREVLRKAKALIVPSKWPENCPYVVLEALALGTPVIVAKAGGMPELVIPGMNGFVFQNQMELAEIIDKINGNQTLLASLSLNALTSSNKYSSSDYYQQLMAVYQSLIKGIDRKAD
jgi:glycosyltransferase involved in cell wall biosynthesis